MFLLCDVEMNMSDVLKDTDGNGKQEESSIPCFRCGVCCSRYQVRMSLIEAHRIADELGVSWDEFVERYTDRYWPGTESFLLRHSNGACIFLKPDEDSNIASCLIHPFRPSSCREWNSSQYHPECQEGLNKYWGLKISPEGNLQDTNDRIKRFQSFWKSLE